MSQIVKMTSDGCVIAKQYVNPSGYVHNLITLSQLECELVERGEMTAEASWFNGYAWTILECQCGQHLGWKFTRVDNFPADAARPEVFYGLSHHSIAQADPID
mmetsp:Transcript_19363/g.33292  ORF Transcript_19363/g.33292 Transcript_19363/m.33292 type:complete len:103 (+) Transcript_19363:760-1068(+)